MASMTFPFQELHLVEKAKEKAIEVNDSLASYSASKLSAKQLLRAFWAVFVLTVQLKGLTKSQRKVVGGFCRKREDIQKHDPIKIVSVAERMEALVSVTDDLIANVRSIKFPPWDGFLREIEAQNDRLDCLAETLFSVGDENSRSEIQNLVKSAEAEHQSAGGAKASWRDFVATLQD